MKYTLLSALLALSPFAANAGSTSGKIAISITILPSCKIESAEGKSSVNCAEQSLNHPHISETVLINRPGASLTRKLVTIAW